MEMQERNLKQLLEKCGRFNELEMKLRLIAITQLKKSQLKKVMEDPNTDMMDLALCMIMQKAVIEGDASRLQFFLDRIFGKVKEKVEISAPKPTVIKRINGDIVELTAKEEPNGKRTYQEASNSVR